MGHKVIPAGDRVQDSSLALRSIALSSPQLNVERFLPSLNEKSDHKNPKIAGTGGDHIIQLLVEKPLLVKGRKFDLRLFVFVRSFVPFEGQVDLFD